MKFSTRRIIKKFIFDKEVTLPLNVRAEESGTFNNQKSIGDQLFDAVKLGVILIVVLPVVYVLFLILILVSNWRPGKDRVFARNGISQIQPAAEMDKLYPDCRHYIVYSGRESISTWNTTAFFGGRYSLTMQVPVRIKSKNSGSMIGDPKFYLNEVEAVTVQSSGQIMTSFSRNLNFDADQWEQVYKSGGDFETIGFTIKTTSIKNFKLYADDSRPSD